MIILETIVLIAAIYYQLSLKKKVKRKHFLEMCHIFADTQNMYFKNVEKLKISNKIN